MNVIQTVQELIDILHASKNGAGSGLLYKGRSELARLNKWLQTEAVNPINTEHCRQQPVSINESIRECEKCEGIVEKKIGYGSGKNGVMIILNSPKMMNKVERQIHKKESIGLLRKIVAAIKLEFDECYITNVIKCEVTSYLLKPSQMVENCSGILENELAFYKPKVVIVMGDLIPLQKVIKTSKGISWFNIDHPITLIKNPDLKRNAWKTLKLVMQELS